MGNKPKTGTREWAVKTVNCLTGCTYGCRYCYARSNAMRFKRIGSVEEWRRPKVKQEVVDRRPRKAAGWVMFPSSHDLCGGYLMECFLTLEHLLEAGNRVLVVSKPRHATIGAICARFQKYREQVLFRFTIGTLNDRLAGYWEPFAPMPTTRLRAVEIAFRCGWQTSVSMEPLLDAPHVDELIERVDPFVTETIWIGTMREMKRRIIPGTDPEAIADIAAGQTPEMIRSIHERWKGHPKLRWKDSYRKVIDN